MEVDGFVTRRDNPEEKPFRKETHVDRQELHESLTESVTEDWTSQGEEQECETFQDEFDEDGKPDDKGSFPTRMDDDDDDKASMLNQVVEGVFQDEEEPFEDEKEVEEKGLLFPDEELIEGKEDMKKTEDTIEEEENENEDDESRVFIRTVPTSSDGALGTKGDGTAEGNNADDLETGKLLGNFQGSQGSSTTELVYKEEKDEDEVEFTEDTFTFMLSCRLWTIPFFTAVLVTVTKSTIFIMFLRNMASIPSLVPRPVLLAQFLTIAYSALTQNDLLTAVMSVYHGYTKDFMNIFPGAGTFPQWVSSTAVALSDGMLGLYVSFKLIVSSKNVLDVLLNFAAVEFVSSLDEIIFVLAMMGILGRSNKQAAKFLRGKTYKAQQHYLRTPFVTMGVMFSVLLAFLVAWLLIFVRQRSGRYAPSAVYIQFEDKVNAMLAGHSGTYRLVREGTNTKRGFSYVELRGGERFSKGYFKYCTSSKVWGFFIGDLDPCEDLALVTSSKIDSYDILDAVSGTWHVWMEGGAEVAMENFYLDVICNDDSDCSNGNGRCINGECDCDVGFSGVRCTYSTQKICSTLAVDTRYRSVLPANREIAKTFQLYTNGTCYDYPVYFNKTTSDVLFYTGLRWAIAKAEKVLKNTTSLEEVLDHLTERNRFHTVQLTEVDVMSEPVLFKYSLGTQATPVALEWLTVNSKKSSFNEVKLLRPTAPSQLLCATCGGDNPCLFDGSCNDSTGSCTCKNGASGSLCQVAPLGNGRCEPFFNYVEFDFDGGDCCASTCVDTDLHSCGIVNVGDSPSANVGFDQCNDTEVLSDCKNGQSCWVEVTEVDTLATADGARVILSANGRVLVVSEFAAGVLRVFVRKGPGWKQLGNPIRYTESNLVFTLPAALYTKPGNAADEKKPSIRIAAHDSIRNQICFYGYSWFKGDWEQLRGTLNVSVLASESWEYIKESTTSYTFTPVIDAESNVDKVESEAYMIHGPPVPDGETKVFSFHKSSGDAWPQEPLSGNVRLSRMSLTGDVRFNYHERNGISEIHRWELHFDNNSAASIVIDGTVLAMQPSHESLTVVIRRPEGSVVSLVSYSLDLKDVIMEYNITIADLPNFSDVLISAGGGAVALQFRYSQGTNPGKYDAAYHVFVRPNPRMIPRESTNGWVSLLDYNWRYLGNYTAEERPRSISLDQHSTFGISDNGATIAHLTLVDGEVIHLFDQINRGKSDEVLYRVSLSLGTEPLVDFELSTVRIHEQSNTTVWTNDAAAVWKHQDSDKILYANTDLVEEMWIPRQVAECIALGVAWPQEESDFNTKFFQGEGYSAFLFDYNNSKVSLLASSSKDADADWLEPINYTKCPKVSVTCENGKSLLEFLTPNIFCSRFSLSREVYVDVKLPDGLWYWDQICLPDSECYSFNVPEYCEGMGRKMDRVYWNGVEIYHNGKTVGDGISNYTFQVGNCDATNVFGENPAV